MLLHTINRAKQRLFFHFHDAGEFKEEEHPRNKGKFTKKGTGSSGAKPKAAPGATVVNPVAVALKSHGYEKQKGSNTFKHPSGHEVEVHAASEGQKWLTGWTHGTTGQTGSGAGKLDKHLQSIGGTAPSKAQAEPAATPSPKPPTFAPSSVASSAAAPHPLNNVHNGVSKLGFVPFSQTKHSTKYEHPDTGDEVVIMNDTPKKGIHKKHVAWTYYPKGGGLIDGHGIANGSLEQAVDNNKYHRQQQQAKQWNFTPIKEHVVKPSWAKYPSEGYATWKGESAQRYYTGTDANPIESLVIGTGANNKGDWQLWSKAQGTIAAGTGQDELNAAFEKLHPRGAGGKFVAKPDQVDQKDHDALVAAGYKPLAEAPWHTGAVPVHVYGKDDGSILLTKPLQEGGHTESIFPPSKEAFANHENFFKNVLWGTTPKAGEVPGEVSAAPAGVNQSDHDTLTNAGYKPLGEASWGEGMHLYGKEDGSVLLTKPLPNAWNTSIIEPTLTAKNYEEVSNLLGGKEPKVGEVPPPPLSSAINKASMTSLFAPLQTKNFTIHADENGNIAGHLQNHPTGLKMVYNYSPTTKQGTIAWQSGGAPGDNIPITSGSTPAEALHQITKKYYDLEEAAAKKPEKTPFDTFGAMKNDGFTVKTTAPSGVIFGHLQKHPGDLIATYAYNPTTNKGSLSWQWPGNDPQDAEFTGTASEIHEQISQKFDEIKSSPLGSGAQHFSSTTLGAGVPNELHGIPFKKYDEPTDWASVEGQSEHLQEPAMDPKGKKVSAGVLIQEPDGRVWIVKPKNAFGGYEYTFPKGGQEPGLSLQATAIKEAWEESGLKVEISGFAGDYEGDTSMTRYYLAKRTGGTPIGYKTDETSQVSLIPKEELSKYLNKARDLTIAKDHFSPKAIGRPISLAGLKKVGEKKGSNPGGTYESASGKQYYVKIPQTSDHASNELLAAELMSKAGGGTFKYHAINGEDGKLNVGTEFEKLQKDNVSQLSPAERKKAQSDFALNAWLANWDAAGLTGDNIGVLNGKVINLDVGGSLLYRAQGEPKGAAFGNTVNEWDTLRDAAKNASSAKLYGDMTPQQMIESADKLKNITNDDIHNAVSNWFESDVGTDLVDKLIARRDDILQKAAGMNAAEQLKTAAAAKAAKPPPPPPPADVFSKLHHDSEWDHKPQYKALLQSAPKPTKKQGAAIAKYSGGDYKAWNRELRNSLGYSSGYDTKSLSEYLAKSSFPEERKVKRRVSQEFAKFLVAEASEGTGHEFVDHGFASSDHWSGDLTLHITIPKGAQAAAIGNYSHNHTEDEILIQAGSKYRITNYDPNTSSMEVELIRSGVTPEFVNQTGRPVGIKHK